MHVGTPPSAIPAVQVMHGHTMGTTWTVRAVLPAGSAAQALQDGIQATLDLVDGQMSTYQPHSALSRFNAAPAGTWQRLPAECFEVIAHALKVARASDGAYDPTVGPLVNLWGFGPDAPRREPPSEQAIAAVRERVGWWKVEVDASIHGVFQPGGIYLDLSSVAKGYGVDRVGRYLDSMGVASWLVEVGGELKGKGTKPDGSPWRIGIERPGAAAGAVERMDQLSQVLTLRNRAIATSGNYRRTFAASGMSFSHHIDPRSGWPVAHAVASVSVLADEAMQADPIGTLMTVLGPEQGLAFARQRGLAVLLILHGEHGLEERLTPAFAEALAS
ncbi:FAD:protein FMN transferase [Dyella soli]|uniref:FAD:protein FMN transferase n=1 Tax=Dyella soli TaxID=522319 RepID=A0A4R0YPU1_9GAMM|nr:FAD:protein FMN transferase [Dyella soli]TCI10856.1 FAD:protein FMN transferase [Dyella soli]